MGVMDAAYDLNIGDDAWLGGVLRAAESSLGAGRFLSAFTYDFSQPGDIRVDCFVARNGSRRSTEIARALTCTLANHYRSEILGARPIWLTMATASELGRERVERLYSGSARPAPRMN
jgi:hypothetical protein